MKLSKLIKIIGISSLLALVVFGMVKGGDSSSSSSSISYPAFKKVMESYKGEEMTLHKAADGTLQLTVKGDTYQTSIDPLSSTVDDLIKEYNVVYTSEMPGTPSIWSTIFKVLMWGMIGYLILSILLSSRKGGGAGGVMNVRKIGANVKREVPDMTMKDVGGITPETKEEISWAIKLFKGMKEALSLGVSPTKAMLFYGPPGTGKTTIAKAMAGEMNATFFQTSGSEFVEMFVGVGASRVRNIFEEAKKHAPSIVFIDEFDAIGGKRGSNGSGAGDSEKEQTLNQLLVELSELKPEDEVFVIAATNLVEKLDPALIRPGRFDYKIKIDLPDVEGRKEIIAIHSKGKRLAAGVKEQLEMIAKSMYGYSGADIEDVFKQAARKAFFDNRAEIQMEDISYALDRGILGSKGRPHATEDLKKRIAYHEAGHALLQALIRKGSIRKATIVPRGNAGGVVMTVPDENSLSTRKELVERISMTVAGGIAEQIMFGEHSVGVSSDLNQSKQIIERMVDAFGMATGDMKLFFSKKDKESEMQAIFTEAMNLSRKRLDEHRDSFHRLAETLMEKETLSGDEIEEIVYAKENDRTLHWVSNH